MKVKICGITNIEDALLVSDLGANYLGFILYKESKRYISPVNAKSILIQLPSSICKVAVFVNEKAELVNSITEDLGFDFVQLHGDESAEYLTKIKSRIIKSFRVTNNFNYSLLSDFTSYNILLDTYSPNNYGGTGSSFNWDKIPDGIRDKVFIAGGVSAKNIEHLFKTIKPYAVDLSSSVEEFPGKKSKKRLTEFFDIIDRLRNNNI